MTHEKVWPLAAERQLENKQRVLSFLNDKAHTYEYSGLFDSYNVVLDSDREQDVIRVNGILTESLSEKLYLLKKKVYRK